MSIDLTNLTVFKNVSPEAVEGILETCEKIDLQENEILIEKEQINDKLYLILEGGLSIFFGEQGKASIKLNKGQTVGELSVIDSQPTSAKVIATKKSRLLVITGEAFWRLTDVSHQFSKNMLMLLAKRTRSDKDMLQENRELKIILEKQTILDPLTTLHNKRWIDLNLNKIIRDARLQNEDLTFIMFDIDHFKSVNDDYGHLQGDFVLSLVGEIIKNSIRPHDFACRYGGEEFLVILPRTSSQDALIPADRIRMNIYKQSSLISKEKNIPIISISGGVSSLNLDGPHEQMDSDIATLMLSDAGKKLYQAKRNGRNRIEFTLEENSL